MCHEFSARAIEVYDHTYKLVTIDGGFVDPNIPAGFAPFGIRNIDGDLFVTYAKQNPQKHDEVAGQGNDFVEFLTPTGTYCGALPAAASSTRPGVSRAHRLHSARSAG